MPNKENVIQGVMCVVETCKYHHPGNLCSAGTIEIKHQGANSVEETDCNTFEPLSMKQVGKNIRQDSSCLIAILRF